MKPVRCMKSVKAKSWKNYVNRKQTNRLRAKNLRSMLILKNHWKKLTTLIKINKNNILIIAYKQGKIFRKFKTDNKFISTASAFKISKAMINFKIDIVEFIDKYPKMEKSCISLYYLKNHFRIIKEVCRENASEFQ